MENEDRHSDTHLRILDLIRAELDLPIDPSREQILDLLNEVLDLKRKVRSKRDKETMDRLHERILSHFGSSMTTLIESQLLDELSAVGAEIAEVNKRREAIYLRAQEVSIRAAEEGLSNSLISRFLGVDRMTVSKYLTRTEIYVDEKSGKSKTRKVPWTHEDFVNEQYSRHLHPSRQAAVRARRRREQELGGE